MSGLPGSFRGAGSIRTSCASPAVGMAANAAPASSAAFTSRLVIVLPPSFWMRFPAEARASSRIRSGMRLFSLADSPRARISRLCLSAVRRADALFVRPESHVRSGLLHRRPGKRAKSPSVDWSRRPCSIASAARCASGTRFALTPGSASRPARISTCRSPG